MSNNKKPQIGISMLAPQSEEFVQWLKDQGHTADLLIFGESMIDNVFSTNCDKVKAELDKLWRSYGLQNEDS